MTLARSTVALLFLLCGLTQAQQISKYEPDARITYDRIRDVTSYRSDDFSESIIGVSMRLAFACSGDTGESPCVPLKVTLMFYDLMGNSFDYTKRDLFILADRNRFEGQMKVTYNRDLGLNTAEIPISIAMLRQLAMAENVEMQVGSVQGMLSKKSIATIGSFYNMAVLNAKQATTPKRGKTRRRKL